MSGECLRDLPFGTFCRTATASRATATTRTRQLPGQVADGVAADWMFDFRPGRRNGPIKPLYEIVLSAWPKINHPAHKCTIDDLSRRSSIPPIGLT